MPKQTKSLFIDSEGNFPMREIRKQQLDLENKFITRCSCLNEVEEFLSTDTDFKVIIIDSVYRLFSINQNY